MKLHRFYTALKILESGLNSLPDRTLAHQIGNVLKLKKGEKIAFFDGSGKEFESEIVSIGKDVIEFRVLGTREVKRLSGRKITLAFALIKKDNMEWVIQKCTELGVSEFLPIIADRSEKKGFNIERAMRIVIGACEQSGRADLPLINEPIRLEEFLAREKRKMIVFHTSGNQSPTPEGSEAVLCVGPEGGWKEEEVSRFKEKGAEIVSLKLPVLRAETAAVAASVLFLAL